MESFERSCSACSRVLALLKTYALIFGSVPLGADDDPHSVTKVEGDDIRIGKNLMLVRISVYLGHGYAIPIVQDTQDGQIGYDLWRICAQAIHDCLHFLGSGASRIGHVDGAVEIISVTLVKRFHGLDQVDALVLVHLRHLAYEH